MTILKLELETKTGNLEWLRNVAITRRVIYRKMSCSHMISYGNLPVIYQ